MNEMGRIDVDYSMNRIDIMDYVNIHNALGDSLRGHVRESVRCTSIHVLYTSLSIIIWRCGRVPLSSVMRISVHRNLLRRSSRE